MKTQRSSAAVQVENPARPLLVFPGGASLRTLHDAGGLFSRAWTWIKTRQVTRSNSKRLQVAATVSLGEKRFVAVIQVDGQQFLVGGGGTNVALLAQLNGKESFGDVLAESMATPNLTVATMAVPKKQPVKRVRKPAAKPPAAQTVKPA
jgi:hypothetical protein